MGTMLGDHAGRPNKKPARAPKPPLSVMARALGLLGMREHTRKELERKLLRPAKANLRDGNPVDRAEVSRVLDELAEKGFQSDDRAAAGVLESKGHKLGTRRLQQTMQQRGASSDLIRSTLAGHDDYEACLKAWTKKFGAPAEDQKEKQKQFRFLASRGFSIDTMKKVMSGIPLDLDSCDEP
jgi:regulatory protein